MNKDKRASLSKALRSALGVTHLEAMTEVMKICDVVAALPAAEREINARADSNFEALSTLESHLKYALLAAQRLKELDSSASVIAALEGAFTYAKTERANHAKPAKRPRKYGPLHLAIGIRGALSRSGVPTAKHASLIRMCFTALGEDAREAESAIKASANAQRASLEKKAPLKQP